MADYPVVAAGFCFVGGSDGLLYRAENIEKYGVRAAKKQQKRRK
jgi:hypothetical protein